MSIDVNKLMEEVNSEIKAKREEKAKRLLLSMAQQVENRSNQLKAEEKRFEHMKKNIDLYVDLPEGSMYPAI